MVTFTEEILNVKLDFLCIEISIIGEWQGPNTPLLLLQQVQLLQLNQ